MNTTRRFRSCLARDIEQFVALRQMEGMRYRSQVRDLMRFDSFLVSQHWEKRWVSRDIIDKYVLSRLHVAPSARCTEMCVVRQFCRYLSSTEPRCYIPDGVCTRGRMTTRIPFVFTESQVRGLLARAGELQPGRFPLRPHMYQMLFGLMYVTGIRISEALALNVGDIDLRQRRLLIRRGKFGKARWITFLASTASRLERYLDHRLRLFPATAEEPLFVSWKAERLSHGTASNNFWLAMHECGLTKQSRAGPTVHSLRHTFACHCLLKWYRAGLNVNARLPSLATYMGHVHVRYTARYIHATPELLDQVNQRFLKHYRNTIKTGDSL